MRLSDTREARPGLDLVQEEPWIAVLPVGQGKLGPLLDQQLQFALSGDGPVSSRSLFPLTNAAVQLLNGSRGSELRARVQRMLAVLDTQAGPTYLRGISLSTSPEGAAANRFLSKIEAGKLPWPTSVPRGDTATNLRTFTDKITSKTGFAAQNAGGWMDLGPSLTQLLLSPPATAANALVPAGSSIDGDLRRVEAQLKIAPGRTPVEQAQIAGSLLGHIVAHEFQHSRTSPDDPAHPVVGIGDTLTWIEEGTAELLTSNGSNYNRIPKTLGLPHSSNDVARPGGYPSWTRALDRLVRFAGLDPDQPADHAAIDSLLQGSDLAQVPVNIARQIAATHHLPDPMVRQIATAIATANLGANGEAAPLERPEGLSDSLGAIERAVMAAQRTRTGQQVGNAAPTN